MMDERYRLVRLLGGGGMAEVYLAVARGAEGFEKPVAIKRMLPHLAQDESIARMFLSEARLATQLHHQNIVEVIDVQRAPEGLFLVMELVNGWDLSIVFGHCAKKSQRIPQVLAVYVAAQVAGGLSHAYRRTLDGRPLIAAHRDISPSNILLSAEGEVKVADFGIARLESLSNGTEPGTFKGKIPYAAPEVIRGKPATPASDQFGLGVVLHKMLTGKHPFGHMDNLVLYAEALDRARPPPMPEVPPELAAIVLRMLQMEPKDRFPSCEELAEALNTYLSRVGVPASADGLARFLQALGMPPTPLQLLGEGAKLPVPVKVEPTLLRGPGASGQPLDDGGFSEAWQGSSGPSLDATGRLEPGASTAPARPAPQRPAPARAQAASVPIQGLAEDLTDAPARSEGEELHLSEEGQRWLQRPEARQAPSEEIAAAAAGGPAGGERRRSSFAAWLTVRLVIALFSLAGLTTGGAMVAPKLGFPQYGLEPLLRRAGLPVPGRHLAMLQIDSTPPGATIRVNGVELGQTPYFQENTYPTGAKVEVKLSAPGYRTWTGTFEGGADAAIDARMGRR